MSDLDQAKRIIERAISVGAPAYNSGDIRRCATLYDEAALQLLDLVPSSLRTRLLEALTAGEDNLNRNDNDYNAKAWALRRVFDSISEYDLPYLPSSAIDGILLEPFDRSQLGGGPVEVMDGVMGGLSTGSWTPQSSAFHGHISLANNGGFAYLRWRFPNGSSRDWSHATGIYFKGLVHSKYEEHTFRVILKDQMCDRVRLSNYKATITNPRRNSDATSLSSLLFIPFTAFDRMEQMGRVIQGSPAFDPRTVTEIGLMAIKPTVIGDFRLEFIEWGLYR